MRYVPERWVLSHFDWYTHDPEKGYQPTDKAPKEAVEAIKILNKKNLEHYGRV